MLQWIRDKNKKRHEERKRKEKQWIVDLEWPSIYLYHPLRYRPVELWNKWGDMQVRVLSRIQQYWPETHSYIRLHIYSSLYEHYASILESIPYEITSPPRKAKDEQIILVPDCQDKCVWKCILTYAGLIPFTRSIFMLDDNPTNWQEVMTRLFEIAEKISDGYPVAEYSQELAMCRCLCYSMDEDLVINKVDLSETTIWFFLKSCG